MGSVIGTAASGVGGLVGNVISSPFNGVSCEYVRLKTTKSGVLLCVYAACLCLFLG